MEVNLNSTQSSTPDYSQSVSRQAAAPATDNSANTGNTMSFERTKALEQSLRDTPVVRPDKVAQAKALVNDPNYPSDEALNRMSGLLAQHINS
jgi:hypothetical protein